MNKTWFEVKNQTNLSSDLYFYGDIVSSDWDKWEYEDTTASDIRDYLNSIDPNMQLNIYINSAGGVVTAGVAIYNMLKRHKGKKVVCIDGIAASISSIIAFAGDVIQMPKSSFLMVHLPLVGAVGNKIELQKQIDKLEVIETNMMEIYYENLRDQADKDKIKNLVYEESWLTGSEASELFNIEIIDDVQAVACASDLFDTYMKTPKELMNKTPIMAKVDGLSIDELNKFENELAFLDL